MPRKDNFFINQYKLRIDYFVLQTCTLLNYKTVYLTKDDHKIIGMMI